MADKKEMTKPIEAEVVGYETPDVGALMTLCIEKGMPVEALEKLVALDERLAARRAAQDFNAALSRFQQECPPIKKSSTAKIATRGGSGYSYTFADLDEIVRTARKHAANNGLSWTWDSEDADGKLKCTCTLRHDGGHSASASFTCPTDSASAMSPQQKVGSALTFAKRQSLVSVLGLTTTDHDFDGGELGLDDGVVITADQALTLDTMIQDKGADLAKFLVFFKTDSLESIPVARYDEAVRMLKAKK